MSTQVDFNTEQIFDRARYEEVCKELKDLLSLKKELEEREKLLRKEVIDMSGGDRMEYGIKVTHKTREGSIDYRKLAEKVCQDHSVFEFYRKPNVEYWEIKSY